MGIALKGMCCVNKPPPQGLADTGNRRDIVSNNCVTCLYCHLQSTHMSFLVGHHTPSKCVHSHTHGAWQQLLLNVSPIPTNPQMHPSSNIASGGSSTVSGKSGHHSCSVRTSSYSCSEATCAYIQPRESVQPQTTSAAASRT